jgi:hypothetical protein
VTSIRHWSRGKIFVQNATNWVFSSVLPLPVSTGRPRPPLSKKVLILTMKLWKMKKSSDFDHEIMNLVEKNVGTPAILGRALFFSPGLLGYRIQKYSSK